MLRLLGKLALPLLLLVSVPGCLFGPAIVIGLVLTNSDESEPSPLPPPGMRVELVGCDKSAPPGMSRESCEEGLRAGVVAFKVTLLPPTVGGESTLCCCYRDANGYEHAIPTQVFRRNPENAAAPWEPCDEAWRIPADLPESGESRWCLWDTAADLESRQLSIVASWGGAKAATRIFSVDNTEVPSISIPYVRNLNPPADTTPDVAAGEEYKNQYEITVDVSNCNEAPQPDDPSRNPVTLEMMLYVKTALSEDSGDKLVPVLSETPGSVDCWPGGATSKFVWDAAAQFPDHRVQVRVEVTPRQLKLGEARTSEAFVVDTRKPRPIDVSPLGLPNDTTFQLTIWGSGFAWPGEADKGTTVWICKANAEPEIELVPQDTFPEDPGHDQWLEGPTTLTVLARSEDLGFSDYRGPLDIWVQNPNSRSALLAGTVSMGPSRASDIGPFYPLEGEPLEVVVGDFVREQPPSPEPAAGHADIALIYKDRSVVKLFGGDGAGAFPDQWVVSLSSPQARPMAIAPVPLEAGRSGVLVATSDSLEFILGGAERGSFSSSVVSNDLAPETQKRDLVVHDFNGDGIPDVAVSGYFQSLVEFFTGRINGESLAWDGPWFPLPVVSVCSMAAANFTQEGMGWADLAVLGRQDGTSTLFVYFSVGNLGFVPEPFAHLQVPQDAQFVTARDGASFNAGSGDEDSIPDLLVTRSIGAVKVLLRWNQQQDAWKLERTTRRSASLGPDPRGLAIFQLPRDASDGDQDIWDSAIVSEQFLAVAYADSNGINVDSEVKYSLTGQARGLCVGDVNDDGLEDAVVLSGPPNVLSVFLANEPGNYDVQEDPFHHPLACFAGENRSSIDMSGLSCGRIGSGDEFWFLVIHDGNTDETIVRVMNLDTLRVESERRYAGLGTRRPYVADLDRDGADDLVFYDRKLGNVALVRSRGNAGLQEGNVFESSPEIVLDIFGSDKPQLPLPLLEVIESLKLRGPTFANLDDNPHLDIILPLTVDNLRQDYVVVILNPGAPAWNTTPPAQRLHFYRTGDDPRSLVVANINNDAALDLVIACEGQDEERGNCVQILFGQVNPGGADARLFYDQPEDPIAPLKLDGYENLETAPNYKPWEVEVVATDSRPSDDSVFDARLWSLASRIFASNNQTVSFYDISRNGLKPGDIPEFSDPQHLLTGADPEDIMVGNFCDNNESLDVIVLDEDGNKLYLITKGHSPETPWQIETIQTGSAPKGLCLLGDEGTPYIANTATGDPEIEIYGRSTAAGDCTYSLVKRIALAEPDKSGGPAGLAVWQKVLDDGTIEFTILASVVEDLDPETGEAAVDFLWFPPGISRDELVRMGAPMGAVRKARATFPDFGAISGLLLGDFCGAPGTPDLLVCSYDGAPTIRCYCNIEKPSESLDDAWKPVESSSEEYVQLAPARLVDWEVVGSLGALTWFVAATSEQVYLLSVDRQGKPEIVSQTQAGRYTDIQQVAVGHFRKGESPLKNLYFAVMQDTALTIERPPFDEAGVPVPWTDGLSFGCLGIEDIDKNGVDDIVVVDGSNSTMYVFLGLDAPDQPFGPRTPYAYSSLVSPVELAFLDKNGDSVTDVAFGARDGEVLVFLGNGNGSFRGAMGSYAGPDLEAIRAIDLDGDGKDEILASTRVPGLAILATETEESER